MKNRRASWIITIALVLLMTMPVMAQDEMPAYTDSDRDSGIEVNIEAEAEEVPDHEESIADEESDPVEGTIADGNSSSVDMNQKATDPADAISATEITESSGNDASAYHEGQESETDTDADEPVIEQAGSLTFVIIGSGDVDLDKDGNVTCTPARGYEIESITADKDAVMSSDQDTADGISRDVIKIKSGDQIPENGISSIEFDDDTTITFVYTREETDDCSAGPPTSAASIFG